MSRCYATVFIGAFWGWKSSNPYRPTMNRRDAETQRVSAGARPRAASSLVLPTADFDPLQPGKSESKILRVVALESKV